MMMMTFPTLEKGSRLHKRWQILLSELYFLALCRFILDILIKKCIIKNNKFSCYILVLKMLREVVIRIIGYAKISNGYRLIGRDGVPTAHL